MTTLAVLLLLAASLACVGANEQGLVSIRFEGAREKCFKEDLPQSTVALFKYSSLLWNPQTNTAAAVQDPNLQLLVTVREPDNNILSRKHSKGTDRLFLTAATSGEHLICFQALNLPPASSYHQPQAVVKFSPEIFIGDAGDPHITPPVALQMHDLSYTIMKVNELVGDIEREQANQRVPGALTRAVQEREAHFQQISKKLNRDAIKWSVLQAIILAGTAVAQMFYLSRFFTARKLV